MEITNVKLTLIVYIISYLGLYYIKPKYMFNEDNSLKSYGTGDKNTLCPIWLVTTIISISFYMFLIISKGEYI